MDTWLPSLKTDSPQQGYELAVTLARVAVKMTQPDATIRQQLRGDYATNAESLIAISQVVASHFATVAAANQYWQTINDLESSE